MQPNFQRQRKRKLSRSSPPRCLVRGHRQLSTAPAYLTGNRIALTSSIPRATWISRPRWSVRCVCWTAWWRRRGDIVAMNVGQTNVILKAQVPLAELWGYANAIRSLSRGRASYTMTPSHFEAVPDEVAAEIVNANR